MRLNTKTFSLLGSEGTTAYATLVFHNAMESTLAIEIMYLLHDEHETPTQGLGLGKQLVKSVIECCRSCNFTHILVVASSKTTSFWSKLRFRQNRALEQEIHLLTFDSRNSQTSCLVRLNKTVCTFPMAQYLEQEGLVRFLMLYFVFAESRLK